MMRKFFITIGTVLSMVGAGIVADRVSPPIHEALAQTEFFGALVGNMTTLTLPFQTTDQFVVTRAGTSFKTPMTGILETANNFSEITGTNRATARSNIGLGPSVSIMDYGATDVTAGGSTSSDSAFTSCITQSKNCYIPPGTFLITCANHNATLPGATNPITVYSDSWQRSTLRIATGAAGCLPTAGLITLANVQNLTIDVNNQTATSLAPILSSFNGTAGIQIPMYKDVHMINVGGAGTPNNANIIGFRVGSTSAQNVVQLAIVRNSYSQPPTATPSTTVNQCILVSQTAGNVSGGLIDSNFCGGSAIDVSAGQLKIINNEVAGWSYRAGIYTEQSSLSNGYNISGNSLHDGAVGVVNGNPTDGVANWGPNSVISRNQCSNLGGVCVVNGGHNSNIADNVAIGTGKRNDQTGGAAYFSLFQDATFNGNNSVWIGNYGVNDGGATPNVIEGFADNTGNAGLSLIGNYFPGVTTPYFLAD